MKEQDFETYWRKNRQTLPQADKGYQQAAKQFKTTSGADMLLYAIPAVAGLTSFDYIPLESEILKWTACAGIVIVSFVICVWIKSVTTSSEDMYSVEQRVKEVARKEWEAENGLSSTQQSKYTTKTRQTHHIWK